MVGYRFGDRQRLQQTQKAIAKHSTKVRDPGEIDFRNMWQGKLAARFRDRDNCLAGDIGLGPTGQKASDATNTKAASMSFGAACSAAPACVKQRHRDRRGTDGDRLCVERIPLRQGQP